MNDTTLTDRRKAAAKELFRRHNYQGYNADTLRNL